NAATFPSVRFVRYSLRSERSFGSLRAILQSTPNTQVLEVEDLRDHYLPIGTFTFMLLDWLISSNPGDEILAPRLRKLHISGHLEGKTGINIYHSFISSLLEKPRPGWPVAVPVLDEVILTPINLSIGAEDMEYVWKLS